MVIEILIALGAVLFGLYYAMMLSAPKNAPPRILGYLPLVGLIGKFFPSPVAALMAGYRRFGKAYTIMFTPSIRITILTGPEVFLNYYYFFFFLHKKILMIIPCFRLARPFSRLRMSSFRRGMCTGSPSMCLGPGFFMT